MARIALLAKTISHAVNHLVVAVPSIAQVVVSAFTLACIERPSDLWVPAGTYYSAAILLASILARISARAVRALPTMAGSRSVSGLSSRRATKPLWASG